MSDNMNRSRRAFSLAVELQFMDENSQFLRQDVNHDLCMQTCHNFILSNVGL